MTNLFITQMFALLVLFPPILWFFSWDGKVNVTVIFIPLSIICIGILTAISGLDLSNFIVILAVALVFFSNLVGFYRLYNHLKSDKRRRSGLVSTIEFLVVAGAVAFCWYFRPEPKPADSFWSTTAQKESYVFDGKNLTKGDPSFNSENTLVLKLFSNPKADNTLQPVFLYLPDLFASTDDCSATISALVSKGYTVVAAESASYLKTVFYPFFYRMYKLLFKKNFLRQKEAVYLEKKADFQEFLNAYTLLVPAAALNGRPVYVSAEGSIKAMAQEAKNKGSSPFTDIFYIHTADYPIDGYVDGYGNGSIFHVAEAVLAGGKRDTRWKQARHIAEAAEIFVKKQNPPPTETVTQ